MISCIQLTVLFNCEDHLHYCQMVFKFFFFFLIKTFSLVRWFFFCCFQEFFLWKGTTKCHIPQGNSIFFLPFRILSWTCLSSMESFSYQFYNKSKFGRKKKPDEKQFKNSQKLEKFNSMNVKKYNYKFFEYLCDRS